MSKTNDKQGPEAPRQEERLVRFKDIQKRVPLCRTTIWRMEKAGEFPKHVKLSKGMAMWVASEVDEWLQERLSKRG